MVSGKSDHLATCGNIRVKAIEGNAANHLTRAPFYAIISIVMPYSKNLDKYPADFTLLAHIPDNVLPHIFTFDSPKAANAWRFKVYGFIEALRAAKHPDIKRMDSIMFRVQGPLVIMELRDNIDANINAEIFALASGVSSPSTSAPEPPPSEPYKSHSEKLFESLRYGDGSTLINKPTEEKEK